MRNEKNAPSAESIKTGQKLQKSGKKTKIKYNQIKASPEAINKHLNKAFDALFKEVQKKV